MMRPTCGHCGMERVTLAVAVLICPRCDTVAQGSGQRVGPPNNPGTRDGWFNAPFGDKT